MTDLQLQPSTLVGVSDVPRLNDLARVTIHQLPASLARLGRMFKPDMQRFKFGWYRHSASKTTWLGFKNPAVHDHDRWLFIVPDEGNAWYRVLREGDAFLPEDQRVGELLLRPVGRQPGHISGIIDRMDSLSTTMNITVEFEDAKPLPLDKMLHYSMMFPNMMMADVLKLRADWDLKDLHDILYHHDAWQARNPEFKSMPQDLVLRMHKLHGFDFGADWSEF